MFNYTSGAKNRKKVLIVDDSLVSLKMARNALMNLYDVYTVPGVEKMFMLLEKVIPDLILLDIVMPDINGYEAINLLKDNPITKDIPVIFLSSRAEAESEFEGLSRGAVDYIIKPFSPQLLLKRVEVHLTIESQRKELEFMNNNLQHIIRQKTNAVNELQNAILGTVSDLVEGRDDMTGKHVARTSGILRLLCEEMLKSQVYKDELESWNLDLLLQSSALHDVGKIVIHDNILLKPAKLTVDEMEVMKKHVIFGENIIDGMIKRTMGGNAFLTHARIMAGTHHEKWDGSGYPRGLMGNDIPLQGRMMAIADVFDALVSERVYKKAYTHEDALEIMNEAAGTQFDPVLIKVFNEVEERFHRSYHNVSNVNDLNNIINNINKQQLNGNVNMNIGLEAAN